MAAPPLDDDLHAEFHALRKGVVESKLTSGLAPKLTTLIEAAALVVSKRILHKVARKRKMK